MWRRSAHFPLWACCFLAVLLWAFSDRVLAVNAITTGLRQDQFAVARSVHFSGVGTVWLAYDSGGINQQPSGWTQTNLGGNGYMLYTASGDYPIGFYSGWKDYGPLTENQATNVTSNVQSMTVHYSFVNPATRPFDALYPSFTINLPATTVAITYQQGGPQSGASRIVDLPAFEVTLDSVTGATVNDPLNPATPPVVPNMLKDLEGKKIAMPIVPYAGQKSLVLGVGNQTYNIVIDPNQVNDVAFTVPANWDGTVTADGHPIDVLSGLSQDSELSNVLFANPYSSTPPAGGTGQWTPSDTITAGLPQGVTWDTAGLPAGVTPDTKLALPTGVSQVSSTAVGNYLQTKITDASGGVTTATNNAGAAVSSAVNNNSTTNNNSTVNNTINNTTINQSQLPTDGTDLTSLGKTPIEGADSTGGDLTGLTAIPGMVGSIRDKATALVGGIRPFDGQAGVGFNPTYTFRLDCGRLGVHSYAFDFSVPPWSYARLLSVAMLALMFSNAFYKRITI